MAALRPSPELADKTNIRPTGNRFTEAWAEDFNELGDILSDHADILDRLSGNATPAPFYGIFDSLAVLQAAFPIGEENAYAIIDNGVGGSQQVAIWDNIAQAWTIGGYAGEIVWLANIGDRPASGSENTLYIIKDSGFMFQWVNASWYRLNETVIGGVSEDADNSLTLGSDDKPYFNQALALDNFYNKTDSDNRFAQRSRNFGNGPGVRPIGDLTEDRAVNLDFDYLDGRYLSGFKQKEAVRVATSANIALSGLQTVDGVVLVAGNRVLVKSQTAPAQNGVYIVATGAWTRSTDFDEPNLDEVAQGASVFVEGGVDNASTGWSLATPAPIIVGTTPLEFIQYAGAANYTGGNKITITGNSINHEGGSWAAKTSLSGAKVISNLAVDAYGHITDWSTRDLTPANIGAEPSFSKSTGFNKNFGTTANTVLEGNWRPSWGEVEGKPTSFTPSAHNHDDRYFRETSPVSYVDSLDDISVSGNYKLNNGTTGNPSGTGVLGASLLHLNWDANAAKQLFFHYTSDDIYLRRKIAGAWTDWTKIWNANNDGAGTGMDADMVDGKHIWSGTLAQYNTVSPKLANTLYIII